MSITAIGVTKSNDCHQFVRIAILYQEKETSKRTSLFPVFGYLEGGFERRLLATVRWTVATAVAFPQKSESIFPHHQRNLFCLPG